MRRLLSLVLSAVCALGPVLAFAGPAVPVQKPAAQRPRPTVRVSVVDFVTGDTGSSTALPKNVRKACDLLQLSCVPVMHGGLQLAIVSEMPGGLLGIALTWATMPCACVAVATNDPQVIAHEMAHLLGQHHVPVPGNLMWPAREGGGPDLLDWQRDAIHAEALAFGRFCAE